MEDRQILGILETQDLRYFLRKKLHPVWVYFGNELSADLSQYLDNNMEIHNSFTTEGEARQVGIQIQNIMSRFIDDSLEMNRQELLD